MIGARPLLGGRIMMRFSLLLRRWVWLTAFSAFFLATTAAAQHDHGTAPASAAPPSAAAVHGIDPADMDTNGKPCEDFYQYADGGWLKKNPIPAEYPSWGTFNELADRNREAQRKILERLAKEKGSPGSEAQKLGDFYTSCMDEAAVEEAGPKPLTPDSPP